MKTLVFDTETSGFANFKAPPEHESQPDIVQIAALLCEPTTDGGFIKRASLDFVVVPTCPVSPGAAAVHGIGPETIADYGVPPETALSAFLGLLRQADTIVSHNLTFDAVVLRTAWHRTFGEDLRAHLGGKKAFCTMKASTPVCRLLGPRSKHSKDYKWPKLEEAYRYFFNKPLDGSHDALVDTQACARIYFELMARRAKGNADVEISS